MIQQIFNKETNGSITKPNGRLCNQIIRNLCAHFIASKFNLLISYVNYNKIKNMGIDLYIGKNNYESEVLVNDDNYFSILNSDTLKNNINLNHNYFQTREITNYIYKYINSIKDSIIAKNPYASRYNNNNDCIIHIRLTDAEQYSLSYEVFENMIKRVNFDKLYITSDNPNHPYIQRLGITYNATLVLLGEVETLQFASTCKSIILSGGTYSAMIGYMAFYSNVYYSEHTKNYTWHGDVFSIPSWNMI